MTFARRRVARASRTNRTAPCAELRTAPVCPEAPNLGRVGVMSGNTHKRYPAELKQRAVRMYAEMRPDQATDWAAMARVAELLGISGSSQSTVW